EAEGRLTRPMASLATYSATRAARSIAANARDLLGGHGILIQNEVARHFEDIEAIHSFVGPGPPRSPLIVREITGAGAFGS
ncbi:acyl-CoA dehydrogenase family protein, partial [Planococcus sp. SIMBA_143]